MNINTADYSWPAIGWGVRFHLGHVSQSTTSWWRRRFASDPRDPCHRREVIEPERRNLLKHRAKRHPSTPQPKPAKQSIAPPGALALQIPEVRSTFRTFRPQPHIGASELLWTVCRVGEPLPVSSFFRR